MLASLLIFYAQEAHVNILAQSMFKAKTAFLTSLSPFDMVRPTHPPTHPLQHVNILAQNMFKAKTAFLTSLSPFDMVRPTHPPIHLPIDSLKHTLFLALTHPPTHPHTYSGPC